MTVFIWPMPLGDHMTHHCTVKVLMAVALDYWQKGGRVALAGPLGTLIATGLFLSITNIFLIISELIDYVT